MESNRDPGSIGADVGHPCFAGATTPGTTRDRLRAVARDLWRAGLVVAIGMIAIPLGVGAFYGIPPFEMLGLVSSVLLFQAFAVLLGLAFSLHPGVILFVVTSVATAVILLIFEIADAFSDCSERIQRWIAKMDEITHKSDFFSRFGDFMLIPIIWIPGIGLYGCALIAWLFGWRNLRAMVLMLIGWLIACVVVILMALGLVAVIV